MMVWRHALGVQPLRSVGAALAAMQTAARARLHAFRCCQTLPLPSEAPCHRPCRAPLFSFPSTRLVTSLQANMWQVNFAASPKTLADIDHSLRVDERVLRWIVLKRRPYNRLPTPYAVARAAEAVSQRLDAQAASKAKQQ